MADKGDESQINDLIERFNIHYEENRDLRDRFSIGSNYSGGWTGIIGSTVYGFLAGMKGEPKDTDLLLERPRTGENIRHLDRYPMEFTGFASIRLKYRGKGIDLIFFPSLIQKTNPQLSDFFESTIYNIQNFIYFPEEKKVVYSDTGLEAVSGRILRFHNLPRARAAAEMLIKDRDISIEEMLVQMIEKKAEQLTDFKYELPAELLSQR